MKGKRVAARALLCLLISMLLCFGSVSALANTVSAEAETLHVAGRSQEPAYGQQSVRTSAARERMGSVGKGLYDALLPIFGQIATGKRASTVVSFEGNELVAMGLENEYASQEEIMNKLHEDLELQQVLSAVLHDCPFELYWFDKTGGSSYQFSSLEEDGVFKIHKFYIIYAVSIDYRGASYPSDGEDKDISHYTVDIAKTAARARLRDTAMEIVEEAEGKSDYLRLLHYAETICEMTSYNSSVAESADTSEYGDAFQLTYVFDGDPGTRTVCEGYAKAFQYLCDLTDFSDPAVRCYTATGSMDGGSHMWNLVTMGNGETYLVDVTNVDEGTVGEGGKLFLAGASGSITTGYRVSLGWNQSVSYQYNYDRVIDFWGSGQDSPLRLASYAYTPADLFIYIPDLIYDGESFSIGFPDSEADVICSLEDGSDSIASYSWSYGWYADINGVAGSEVIEAPTDAGVYWLRVRAEGSDTKDKTVRVEIRPAKLTVQSVTAQGKTYDGTRAVELSAPILGGILTGDEVRVKTFEGMLPSANAGEYDRVILSSVELEGADAHNYSVDPSAEIPCNVRVLPKKGVRATLILPKTEYDYTGEAILPTVQLYDGETVIDPDEYTVSVENNVEEGQATVRIADREGGNYELEPLTGSFTIVKRASPVTPSAAPDESTSERGEGFPPQTVAVAILVTSVILGVGTVTVAAVKRRGRKSIDTEE